jgi:ketosteroid isomerase-like protein
MISHDQDSMPVATARAWLAEMQTCVQRNDYARCRTIFADDVVAFGTRAALVVGLDALEHDQWRQIWETIAGFTFLTESLYCRRYGDEGIWIACPWTSRGLRTDGVSFERRGRITAVLERRGERWLAVHTHHSLVPVPAPR